MSATSFDKALTLVLELEGGFVQDPRDPGGATKFGVTRATLAEARGRPASVADVRALTTAEAGAIYRRLYWNAVRADDLPAGLDLALFDYGVNSGPGRAVRALQTALGLTSDGRLGERTLAAAGGCDVPATIRAITRGRLAFLRALSTWTAFGRGWTSRVTRVEREALALASAVGPAPRPASAGPVQPPSSGEKEHIMDTTKNVFASRTVWANVIGLASVGLGLFGVETGTIDTNGLADAASQIVAGASFVASTVFRLTATKQIGSAPR